MKKLVVGALVVGGCIAANAATWYVKPEAEDGGAGTGWDAPISLAGALGKCVRDDEIWMMKGTYPCAAQYATAKAVVIRGGFNGDETAPEDRPAGEVSTIDGQDTVKTFAVTSSAGTNEFDRIAFVHSSFRGLDKQGNASLVLRDCFFLHNGTNILVNNSDQSGRGAYLKGGAGSVLVISNCTFRGNWCGNASWGGASNLDGSGAYITTFARAEMADTVFAQNGVKIGALDGRDKTTYGACLTVVSAPLRAIRCRFAGNGTTMRNYGTICYLAGGCGGSAFTNCVWSGNYMQLWNENYHEAGGKGGALFVNTGAGAAVDLHRCTFAYNLVNGNKYSVCAGLRVESGTVTVSDSVFHGNVAPSFGLSAADVLVGSASGSCTLRNSWFPDARMSVGKLDSSYSLVTEDLMTAAEDPFFATDTETFLAALNGTDAQRTFPLTPATRMFFRTDARPDLFDVHLKSRTGRWDGTTWVKDGVTSSAIGYGAYAGTAEASKVGVTVPVFDGEVTVDQTRDYTQPSFGFSLADEGDYLATVYLCCGETAGTAGSTEGWETVVEVTTLAAPGGAYAARPKRYYPDGTALKWQLVAVSSAGSSYRAGETAISGTLPPWYGKKGPESVVHVRIGATGRGDGTSWTDAYPTLAEGLAALSADAAKSELWVAGDFTPTADPVASSFVTPAAIRGGFAGTETTADGRAAGALTTIDGNSFANCMNIANAAPLTLERFRFTRSRAKALVRTGSGDFTIKDCVFHTCGTGEALVSGRGATLTGTSAATLFITNTVFSGNCEQTLNQANAGSGNAARITTFRRVFIDDCLFLTNGIPPNAGNSGAGRDYGIVYDLYVSSAPVTVRGTRFVGNRSSVRTGYADKCGVKITGATEPCAFTNCAFVGNCGHMCIAAGTGDAYLELALGKATTPCELVNCTFFGNVTCGAGSALKLTTGAFRVRNSIFYANLVNATTRGADIHVAATATADIDYTLFGGTTSEFISFVTAGSVELRNHVLVGDPSLVTTTDSLAGLLNSLTAFGLPRCTRKDTAFYYKANTDFLASFNIHLRGRNGYTDETTGEVTTEYPVIGGDPAYSIAVDKGDPEDDYSRETDPNGGRINLGFYGNTPWQTFSSRGEAPQLGEVTVDQERDYTQPYFAFALPEGGDYQAEVFLCYGTTPGTAGSTEGWTYVVPVSDAANPGAAFDAGARRYFPTGTELSWQVVAVNTFGSAYRAGSVKLTGETPPWYGKKGPENVVHCRAGATGLGDGSSWSDAFPTVNEAMSALAGNAAKNEVWIAGDFSAGSDPDKVVIAKNATIRGGFAGTETTTDGRAAGSRTTIDGGETYNCLSLDNSKGAVTVERLVFTRSRSQALVRTGSGDFTIKDCVFHTCGGPSSTTSGKGAALTGTAAATLFITNTVFSGNCARTPGMYAANGNAATITTFRRAYIDDCLFLTNGVLPDAKTDPAGRDRGDAFDLLVTTAPVTMRGTRFMGNRRPVRGDNASYGNKCGVRITGATGACAFTNCAFVANMGHQWSGAGFAGKNDSYLEIALGAATTPCELVNCTFFGNTAYGSASALKLVTGAFRIRNSIFYANLETSVANCGADIQVGSGATADIDYSLFAENSTNCLTSAAGKTTLGDHMTWGDPYLVTTTNDLAALLKGVREFAIPKCVPSGVDFYYMPFIDFEGLFNVHLRSARGYVDETTGELAKARMPKESGRKYSPAIDAGDPEGDFSREPQPNGHCVNLGFYGNTPWASMSSGGLMIFIR